MCKKEWHTILEVIAILVLIVWCIAAFPLGRANMRADLMREGYRVVDTHVSADYRGTGRLGDGKWVIEVWRDKWVPVQR